MFRRSTLLLGLLVSVAAVHDGLAQTAQDDMINQLLPAGAKPAASAEAAPAVLSVQAATKDQIVSLLGTPVASRSIGASGTPPLVLGPGHEGQNLAVLRNLPSMQVAVAFQGGSDALSPDAGAVLSTLGAALNDPKLASYRFVIGVHTDSVGSDDYNLSVSSLRARAIVDTLASVQGIDRNRLVPIGFGRIDSAGSAPGAAAERIRVVNLGDTVVQPSEAPALVQVPEPVVAVRKSVAAPVRRLAHHPVSTGVRRVAAIHPIVPIRPVAPVRHVAMLPHPLQPLEPAHPRRHVRPGAFAGLSGVATVRHFARPVHRDTPDGSLEPAQASYAVSPSWDGFSGARGGNGTGGSGGGSASSGGTSSGGASSGGASAGGASSGGSSAGGGTGGGGKWSDRRLKRDIVRLGVSPRGFAIYRFHYVWGGPVMVGVMAQEVALSCPEAVLVGPGGYLQVDYDKLDVAMTTFEAWQAAGHAAL